MNPVRIGIIPRREHPFALLMLMPSCSLLFLKTNPVIFAYPCTYMQQLVKIKLILMSALIWSHMAETTQCFIAQHCINLIISRQEVVDRHWNIITVQAERFFPMISYGLCHRHLDMYIQKKKTPNLSYGRTLDMEY